MWILSFIPADVVETVINVVIILSVLGLIVSFMLSLKSLAAYSVYKIPLQMVSIGLLVVSIYWKGGFEVEKDWQAKVEAAEYRAKLAEERAETANAQIKYVFLDKVRIVKETQIVVQEKIRDVGAKMDENCKIIPELIDIHNQAANNDAGGNQ